MSQIYKAAAGSTGIVDSVTGTNGVIASPTTGNVVVSGVNATTSSVGVASFNPADFTVSGAGEVTVINSLAIGYTPTATNYQVLVTDHIIGITATSSPITITMPSSGMTVGQTWIIKDESVSAGINNITISGNGYNIISNTIASIYVINSDGEAVTIYWNGTAFGTA